MVVTRKIMNIKEAAEYLGVHRSTLYRYAQNKKIPAFKLGADWRFSKKHIDNWIEEQVNGNGDK